MPEKPEVQNAVLYKAADRSTRRYGVRAGIFLVVAVAMALGSALLLTRYMDKRTQAAAIPTATVMVAAMDLPVGTELHAEQLRALDWPAASLPEGCFKSVEELNGKMISVRVYKGEPILPSLLAGSEAGKGLSALLPAGMRAAAVRVDDIVGVAGFIHPGDSVDVIATMRMDGTNVTAARVILQNIKVLAVGKDLDTAKTGEKVVPATVATLLVNTAQSERLALASTQGKLLLTLRGSADNEYVETKGVNPNTMLVTAEPPPPPPPAATPKSEPRVRLARAKPVETVTTTATVAPKGEVVEILRGDLFERRDFQKEGKP
jgi:pilus assembly protein CpaB